jgi:hypothetical protein
MLKKCIESLNFPAANVRKNSLRLLSTLITKFAKYFEIYEKHQGTFPTKEEIKGAFDQCENDIENFDKVIQKLL